MLDDIRNHDANPTEEERSWMNVDGLGVALRACAIGAAALVIGIGMSVVIDDHEAAPNVAVFGPR